MPSSRSPQPVMVSRAVRTVRRREQLERHDRGEPAALDGLDRHRYDDVVLDEAQPGHLRGGDPGDDEGVAGPVQGHRAGPHGLDPEPERAAGDGGNDPYVLRDIVVGRLVLAAAERPAPVDPGVEQPRAYLPLAVHPAPEAAQAARIDREGDPGPLSFLGGPPSQYGDPAAAVAQRHAQYRGPPVPGADGVDGRLTRDGEPPALPPHRVHAAAQLDLVAGQEHLLGDLELVVLPVRIDDVAAQRVPADRRLGPAALVPDHLDQFGDQPALRQMPLQPGERRQVPEDPRRHSSRELRRCGHDLFPLLRRSVRKRVENRPQVPAECLGEEPVAPPPLEQGQFRSGGGERHDCSLRKTLRTAPSAA